MADLVTNKPTYQQIYTLVARIPAGKVATYGQIAAMLGSCTARMVGYAMAALPWGTEIPWQRVINRQGKISLRGGGDGALRQRQLLEAEGIQFDQNDRVDFDRVGWSGPDWDWLAENGFFPSE
jgi:methylated-DNA-protein-cysteine methyltransferase-like protein